MHIEHHGDGEEESLLFSISPGREVDNEVSSVAEPLVNEGSELSSDSSKNVSSWSLDIEGELEASAKGGNVDASISRVEEGVVLIIDLILNSEEGANIARENDFSDLSLSRGINNVDIDVGSEETEECGLEGSVKSDLRR
jgi:hypothetical protein